MRAGSRPERSAKNIEQHLPVATVSLSAVGQSIPDLDTAGAPKETTPQFP